VIGVVVSHATGPLSAADEQNLDVLRRTLGSRMIGELAPAGIGSVVSPSDAGLTALLARLDA
jgi:hypothetical protein